ncbi:hypothetical protein CRUP_000831 [Coryphaenoides rupestris]|nr:hypothetical protein CRUP_000831 [Coryphaenoides rupestris]
MTSVQRQAAPASNFAELSLPQREEEVGVVEVVVVVVVVAGWISPWGEGRCHTLMDGCSPNSCPGGYDCKLSEGLIHCDPLPQVSPMIGFVEIMEICGSILGLLFLVAFFVCVRK